MTTTELEARVRALEKKVEMLAAEKNPAINKQWLLNIWGSFADDPDFQQASHLGRRWRKRENLKSLNPGNRSPKPMRRND